MERNEAYNLYHRADDFIKKLRDVWLVYSARIAGFGTITKKVKPQRLRPFKKLILGEIIDNRFLIIYSSYCVTEGDIRFDRGISRLQKLAQAYNI